MPLESEKGRRLDSFHCFLEGNSPDETLAWPRVTHFGLLPSRPVGGYISVVVTTESGVIGHHSTKRTFRERPSPCSEGSYRKVSPLVCFFQNLVVSLLHIEVCVSGTDL